LGSGLKVDFFYSNNLDKVFTKHLVHYINKPNLRFLEIGSYSGSSASGTINTILTDPTSTLTCIDCWGDQSIENHFDIICQFYSPKIIKVKSDSVEWLKQNQDMRFDFIYVDGDHSTEGVFLDASNAWVMLKNDGIIAFDDYLFNANNFECKIGIDKFLDTIAGQYKILDNGYQLWIIKNSFLDQIDSN